jgi:hypothetical protein
MNIRTIPLGLALFLSLWVPHPLVAQSGKELLSKGDKLADEGKYAEALILYKEAYELILPELRGLNFKHSVEPRFMERPDLQAHMQMLYREDTTDQELDLTDSSLKVFGFVPPSFKTEETVLNLYSEEVAGFYDPKRKQIFLIKEPEKPQKSQKPGLIARLLGAKTGFDKDEQKSTLSHEMAHALADQHFDLVKLQEQAESDDDRSLALQALVEGEATLVMMAEMERANGGNGKEILNASPSAMDFSFRIMQSFLPFASGKTFRTAPPIFRETMMFGYLKGMVFLLHLTNDNEWERVNEAFRKPPLSTEQVLHPEKYLKGIDAPQEIVLPALSELVGADWKELGQNVLGELQISILLRKHWGAKAAAGWGGDRYAVFRGPNDKIALVWFTTWDTETDAKEFAGAYWRYLGTKIGVSDAKAGLNEPNPPQVADRLNITRDGQAFLVARQASDVIVIEGFSDQQTESLASAALKAEKRVKE